MKASMLLAASAGLLLSACNGEGPPGERDVWSADVPEAVALDGSERWAQRPAERPPEAAEPDDDEAAAAADEADEDEVTPDEPSAEPETPVAPPPTVAPVTPPATPPVEPTPAEDKPPET